MEVLVRALWQKIAHDMVGMSKSWANTERETQLSLFWNGEIKLNCFRTEWMPMSIEMAKIRAYDTWYL